MESGRWSRPGIVVTFVSNKPEWPMNTRLGVSNKNDIGSQDPIGYPIDAIRGSLRKEENPDTIGVFEWRDPGSNRGHHDFQDSAQESLTSRNPCGDGVLASSSATIGLPLFAIFCPTIGYSDRREYPMLAQFRSLAPGEEQVRQIVMAQTCFVADAGVGPAIPQTIEIRPEQA